eukprot:m.44874 g.44874  ORF g.44874 m.44874 type:complete len:110 (+) comp11740_c0_seq3:1482-1811(+)
MHTQTSHTPNCPFSTPPLSLGACFGRSNMRAMTRLCWHTYVLGFHVCSVPSVRALLPSLPEKKLLGKLKPSVVEQRKMGLQAFLDAAVALQREQPIMFKFISHFLRTGK